MGKWGLLKTWARRIFSIFLIVEEIQQLRQLLAEQRITAATLDAYPKEIEFLRESHDANKQLLVDEKEGIKHALEEENQDLRVTLQRRTQLLTTLLDRIEKMERETERRKQELEAELANYKPLPAISVLGGLLQNIPPPGGLASQTLLRKISEGDSGAI